LIADVSTDPDYLATLPEIRSELAVPVIRDGVVIGVLNVESGAERRLGAWDQVLVELFSQQVVVTLANVSRFEDANVRATVDGLTGLPNHRASMTALEQELERGQRYGRPFAVCVLDLDHFKALNDGFGHAAGDATLRELAQVVRQSVRGVDIPGRLGGEEFVIILPEVSAEAAMSAAERIRLAVAQHSFAVGGGTHVTCSLGIASYPDDGTERDALLAAADRALYAAKQLGRNQFRSAGDPTVDALLADAVGHDSREATALAGTIDALVAMVEARDAPTGQHGNQVADLAVALGLEMGLERQAAQMLGIAGRLHDIGKVAVPDAILQKPSRLTTEEWQVVAQHPTIGADILCRVPALRAIAPIIRAHHERWDGLGYPDGLIGAVIPLSARIVAVVDAFHAMTSERPYRQAQSVSWACAELERGAGSQFDPDVVTALQRVVRKASASVLDPTAA